MEIKVLSPLWGHEQLEYKVFLDKMRMAGYDGFDTWIPDDPAEKRLLFQYLQTHQMYIVTHQHQAEGKDFTSFKSSFKKNLERCAEPAPLLINSHTGRDYFSFEENLELIDIAGEFSEKTGITVAHEMHRGRVGYSPQMLAEFFKVRKNLSITADFSHWVCVTESMLQHFSEVLAEAIGRSRHIHARVGFEQGPQVPHPAAPEWQYAVDHFFSWWDRIIETNINNNCKLMPVTTEFGPQPYMPSLPFSNNPIADLFEINCYMKDMIKERYSDKSSPATFNR